MPRSRPRARRAALSLAVPALVVGLVPGLVPGTASAAAEGTCVGKGEYKRVHGGMTIEKLGNVLDGQTPFAETAGQGRKRIRWYVACEAWQPDKDVAISYHQPIVGRRTVTKKALAVYAPARAAG